VRRLFGLSPGPVTLRWLLLAALLTGAVLGAQRAGRFRIDRGLRRWRGHLAGGFLMGLGTALVPGGNDVLVLHGVPAMSPHALPALAGMMAGIAGTLTLVRLGGHPFPRVDCRGDVCRDFRAGTAARAAIRTIHRFGGERPRPASQLDEAHRQPGGPAEA
ncbi:MAG TPA: YeeE/YedE thiosulfate transporter family protein, partial [Woeseiaceae bacterium]|nr:YeeE/YedE thiosulfate transporter family protein [Woeseiaceae bacterium]